MSYPNAITAIFEGIVARTSAEVLPLLQAVDSNITGVRYDYGSWTEINDNLIQMTGTDKEPTKYPFIFLKEDIREFKGRHKYYSDVRLSLFICIDTNEEYTTRERDEKHFDPILMPIYYELLRQIANDSNFIDPHEHDIRHEMIKRKRLGKETLYGNAGNKVGDFIDGIEIANMELTTRLQNCLTPVNLT